MVAERNTLCLLVRKFQGVKPAYAEDPYVQLNYIARLGILHDTKHGLRQPDDWLRDTEICLVRQTPHKVDSYRFHGEVCAYKGH